MSRVVYNPTTGVLEGNVKSIALLAQNSSNYMTHAKVTFPRSDDGEILVKYCYDYDNFRHKNAYPTEDYDTYTRSHDRVTNKLRRGLTGGATRYGRRKEHNKKYRYRKFYDKLSDDQKALIAAYIHDGAQARYHRRYGHENLATHEALGPGDGDFGLRL